MSDRKAVIKNADMAEDMQQDAVDCATQALEKVRWWLFCAVGRGAAARPAPAVVAAVLCLCGLVACCAFLVPCRVRPLSLTGVAPLLQYNIEKNIASYIKREFDKKYNPTWHCIVGRNFGSYVTHETKHFIYFYLGQVAVLLFKSG